MMAPRLLVWLLAPPLNVVGAADGASAAELKLRGVAGVFINGFGGYQRYFPPAIVKQGEYLLAFVEARRNGPDQDHIDLLMKRSADGGRSWMLPQLVAGDPESATQTVYGNPTPIANAATNTTILIYCVNNTWVFQKESTDAGKSWSVARNITSMVKRPGWGWYATGPSHGLAMKNGRLIVPFNTFLANKKVTAEVVTTGCFDTAECKVYHGDATMKTRFSISNTADASDVVLSGELDGGVRNPTFVYNGNRAGILYSDDHGQTWHLGGQILDYVSSSENTVEEIWNKGNSELLMSFRVENPDTFCRKMARSLDGGLSFEPYFEPAVSGGDCIPDPTCQGSMLSVLDGQYIYTSGPGDKHSRKNAQVHMSSDGGRTFELLGTLNNGTATYSDIVLVGQQADVHHMGVLMGGGEGVYFVEFDVLVSRGHASGTVMFA